MNDLLLYKSDSVNDYNVIVDKVIQEIVKKTGGPQYQYRDVVNSVIDEESKEGAFHEQFTVLNKLITECIVANPNTKVLEKWIANLKSPDENLKGLWKSEVDDVSLALEG